MKFGVRKPSVKKSFKARTTGKAKRAVKKAIIPGYGQKGSGWIKDPKRAAYNKVYNKTSVGLKDLAKVPSTSSNRTKRNKTVLSNTNTSVVSTQMAEISFNMHVKDKPTINSTLILFVIGIITLLLWKTVGIFLLILASYFLYNYIHRNKIEDYISSKELQIWEQIIRKYNVNLIESPTFADLSANTRQILRESYCELQNYYTELSHKIDLSPQSHLNAIKAYNACLELEKYATYKTSDTRFLKEQIKSNRIIAVHHYINAEYKKAVSHSQSLKTNKGKLNQIEHYKTIVTENLYDLYSDFTEYMNSKINVHDFVID